jgi:hypothetical protein
MNQSRPLSVSLDFFLFTLLLLHLPEPHLQPQFLRLGLLIVSPLGVADTV